MAIQKSVNTVISNEQGKFLLQMRDGTQGICNPLQWNFFGGTIDENEDPLLGAIREAEEELGIYLEAKDCVLMGELHPKPDRLVYIVQLKQPLEWGGFTLREGAGAGYFTKEELLKINITPTTQLLVNAFL